MRRIILSFSVIAALSACGTPQPAGDEVAANTGIGSNAGYAEPLAETNTTASTNAAETVTAKPSFDCAKAATDVERMICGSERLAALDRTMAMTYRSEREKGGNSVPVSLEARQHAFLKARNACDSEDCIAAAYEKLARGGFDRSLSGDLSCSADIGMAAAKQLVDQCVKVSPATHPPCNVANSCAMIRGEIERSCAMFDAGDPNRPDFCGAG